MASKLKNLSEYDPDIVPSAADMKFGILVSEWNHNITGALLEGALSTLRKHGAKDENIIVRYVPGSFELVAGSRIMAEHAEVDAVICFGSVIRGDTPHFDYVCQGTTQGISYLNANYKIPFIFGLLTTDNLQQALDRCGGAVGNKGIECAVTAIKMIALQNEFEKKR